MLKVFILEKIQKALEELDWSTFRLMYYSLRVHFPEDARQMLAVMPAEVRVHLQEMKEQKEPTIDY